MLEYRDIIEKYGIAISTIQRRVEKLGIIPEKGISNHGRYRVCFVTEEDVLRIVNIKKRPVPPTKPVVNRRIVPAYVVNRAKGLYHKLTY